MSGIEKNPQMIMWDPATYPDVETIADLGEAGDPRALLRRRGVHGLLHPDRASSRPTRSTAATTARRRSFVAAEGADAQQGFGSAEPYIYENEVADWGKPVAYAYINDAGWENYAESIATKPENIETYADCFEQARADHPAVERRLPRPTRPRPTR